MRRPNETRVPSVASTALAFVVLMLGTGPAGAELRAVLSHNQSIEAVTKLLDTAPVRCTQGIDRRVCTWLVADENPVRAKLASDLAGPGTLHVVCDFDALREDRVSEPSSCSIHEPAMPRTRTRRLPRTSVGEDEAALTLRRARTLVQLSHAFASSPVDCVQRDEAEWVCAWVAQPHKPGHAILGALADTAGAARLICRLPIEAGEREEDSCRAQEID